MNRLWIGILGLTLAAAGPALAQQPVDAEEELDSREAAGNDGQEAERDDVYERVRSITLLNPAHDFDVVDTDSVIIWRNRNEPYLLELSIEAPDLRHARDIGVTSFGSRITDADAVEVRGVRYPIEGIYKLEPEEANRLTGSS